VALSRWKQIHNTPDNATGCRSADQVVLGLGTDLCAVARLERELAREHSEVLVAVFRPDEHRRCLARPHAARAYAACFAAKEAVIKALAEARGQGTFWQDIEIGDDDSRHPVVDLQGRLADLARGLGVERIHISWAHGREYATACAIVSGSAPAAPPDPKPDDRASGPANGGR